MAVAPAPASEPTAVDHREAAAPAAPGPRDPYATRGPGVPAGCCAWRRSAMDCSAPESCFPVAPPAGDHREAAAPGALGPRDPYATRRPGVPAGWGPPPPSAPARA